MPPRSETRHAHRFWACPECDYLMHQRAVPDKQEANCPRCGYTLVARHHRSVERTLALAITGLILFFPANLFPVLSLQALGLAQQETIFSSVVALYDSRLYAVSALVLMTAIIVPFIKMLLMVYLSASLMFHRRSRGLSWAMRSYQQLDSWGMLEIYLLGVFVSMIKLVDIAEVTPGIGLYSMAALILTTLITSTQLDQHRFWRRIEQLERAR